VVKDPKSPRAFGPKKLERIAAAECNGQQHIHCELQPKCHLLENSAPHHPPGNNVMSQMSESELKSILAAEIADSLAHLGGDSASKAQGAALLPRRALRERAGGPQQGGVDRRCGRRQWILPSLLKIFTAGDEVVRFEPTGPEDEEVAKQATEYVNWIFAATTQASRFSYELFKDALLQKNGIAKVWWEEGETATRESYQRKASRRCSSSGGPDVEPIAHSEYRTAAWSSAQTDCRSRRRSPTTTSWSSAGAERRRAHHDGAAEEFLIGRRARSWRRRALRTACARPSRS
jgi:hypothetical protein